MGVTFWFSVIIKIYQYIMHMIVGWILERKEEGGDHEKINSSTRDKNIWTNLWEIMIDI